MDPENIKVAVLVGSIIAIVVWAINLAARMKLFDIHKELKVMNNNLLAQAEDAREFQAAVLKLLERPTSSRPESG